METAQVVDDTAAEERFRDSRGQRLQGERDRERRELRRPAREREPVDVDEPRRRPRERVVPDVPSPDDPPEGRVPVEQLLSAIDGLREEVAELRREVRELRERDDAELRERMRQRLEERRRLDRDDRDDRDARDARREPRDREFLRDFRTRLRAQLERMTPEERAQLMEDLGVRELIPQLFEEKETDQDADVDVEVEVDDEPLTEPPPPQQP